MFIAKTLYWKIQRLIPMDFTKVLLLPLENENGLDRNSSKKNDTEQFPQLRFSKITENQLRRHIDDPQYELSNAVVSSVSDEQVMCFGVYVENTLAGYVFFCGSPVDAQRNSGGGNFTGIELTFPDYVCYLYKMLVLPDYRGRRLSGKLIRFAASQLVSDSISHIITTTDWTNTSFLKSTLSIGFKPKGIAGEYLIFGNRRYVLPAAIAVSENAGSIVLSEP